MTEPVQVEEPAGETIDFGEVSARVMANGPGALTLEEVCWLIATAKERVAQSANADAPFPPDEIIRHLADATDHLLHSHNCDTDGYETWQAALDAARALPVPVGDETEALRAKVRVIRDAIGRLMVPDYQALVFLDELEARVAGLEAREAELRSALKQDREKWSFDTLVFIARQLLETNYPAHIFVGTSGDPGAAFVVRLREALAALADSGEAGS